MGMNDFINSGLGPIGTGIGMAGRYGQTTAQQLGLTSGFHATTPPIQTQDIISDINRVKGTPAEVEAQQQALAQALLRQSQGFGPNPAQIALQQATNRNVQQGAGMLASQKGINPSLAARQIAQNAAMQQQQAAGQGALMGAQQQLGAQNQLGNVYGQIAGESLQNLGILENAQAAQNNAINTGYLGAQQINAGVSMGNAQNMQKVLGSVASGAGGALAAAHGAKVPHNKGKKVPAMVSPGEIYLTPGEAKDVKSGSTDPLEVGEKIPGKANVPGDDEANDTVSKHLSPGGVVIPRSKAQNSEKAKEFVQRLKDGGEVKTKGYGAVLEAQRKLEKRIAELEKRLKSA